MSEPESIDELWRSVVLSFRLGLEARAHHQMVALMDAMLPFMEANVGKMGPPEVALIKQLLAAQGRGDFLYLADLLEYELPRTALAAMLASSPPTD